MSQRVPEDLGGFQGVSEGPRRSLRFLGGLRRSQNLLFHVNNEKDKGQGLERFQHPEEFDCIHHEQAHLFHIF